MSTDPRALEIESLLEHRDFVARLARSLVRDPHAAEDVVQDTWIAALRRPPGAIGSVRGWLARVVRNQAHNARRGAGRRAVHERATAQSEAVDSAEGLRERVELQHGVVGAVLALQEPYRTTVLQHYYEGLPASEIAARRGCPVGTVRSQLARALGELRARLDREHGGDRRAWSALLLRIAGGTPEGGTAIGLAAKLGAAALVVCGAALVVRSAWFEPQKAPAELAQARPSRNPLPPLPSATEGLARPVLAGARAPVPPVEVADAAPAVVRENLESSSIDELLTTATRIELLLRARLLIPDAIFERDQAALLRLPDTGLARILPRGRFGRSDSSPVMLRGAGAYYSFVTRSNDYDQRPTLGLDGGEYRSTFYGQSAGLYLELGSLPLADLSRSVDRPPTGLSAADLERWRLLWTDARTGQREFDRAILDRSRELGVATSAPAKTGATYLVRCISPGEHDLLAAFTCLAQDDYGHTLAWRILARWEVAGATRPTPATPIPPELSEPELWMTSLSTDELLATLATIRARGEALLLQVPDSLTSRFAGAPIARILFRGRCDSIVEKRGGLSYFSFATQDNDYDREPDLGLENRTFRSGFAGCDAGFLLHLGEIPLEEVGGSAASPPADLAPKGRAAWDFLWTVERAASDAQERAGCVSESDLLRAEELGVRRGARALVGHTYLLRSIPAEHDVVAAFTPVAEDEYGLFIAWRVLQSKF
jgi:RNA polymerase sigma factor (sigma-70 family)